MTPAEQAEVIVALLECEQLLRDGVRPQAVACVQIVLTEIAAHQAQEEEQ